MIFKDIISYLFSEFDFLFYFWSETNLSFFLASFLAFSDWHNQSEFFFKVFLICTIQFCISLDPVFIKVFLSFVFV